jgi:hypothetical protein
MNMLFAFMLVELVDSPLYRRIIIISLLLYNFTFLQINNWNWRHASKITRAVITEIKGIAAAGNKVMLVNLPGEYRGAYIFRNSFDGVKFLTGIENAQIQAANYLSHAEYFSTPDPLVPITSGGVVCFGPAACLSGKQLVVLRSKPNERADTISIGNSVQIWYWDKQKMVQFDHRSPAR